MKNYLSKYKYFIVMIGILVISYTFMDTDILKYNMQNSSNTDFNMISLLSAIAMEAFVSIHMTLFVLWPLSNLLNNPKFSLKNLFIARVLILLICDIIISPMGTAMFDFIMVFVGAFILIPLLALTKKQDPYAKMNSTLKINNVVKRNKYDLATILVNYLFALSENDKEEVRNLTTEKMCDNAFKLIDNSETYNKRYIIDDIDIINFDIAIQYINNNEEYIHAKIIVNALDYVEYGNIPSHERKREFYEYRVIFKKSKNNIVIPKGKLDRCPYCSAAIVDKNIQKCDYCGGILFKKNNEWLIDKLEKTLIK